MRYRKLTRDEISALESQGCGGDFDGVEVRADADMAPSLRHVGNVTFSGTVRFGLFEEEFTLAGGVKKHSGLKNVTLHNVCVGDNSYIGNISNYVANYDIGSRTLIDNVDVIVTEGESSFGNGVRAAVLNETGGREVTMVDRLSAHLAYIMALYRHRPLLSDRLKAITDRYTHEQTSSTGTIGSDVTVRNTGSITDVRIGDHATVSGAGRLRNGTIVSNASAPVTIGYGVVAEDFIVCSGSSVEDNVTLGRCFVGQACKLGHGYSASDSLFFSNSQGENGEACAIFAGPFTVTHHKSTLLIAGMYSFMNAGSGSNQSNHMYKLGPIHQGILERGAKTASDSYILWPSRVGAFSLVMGRHVTHSDTVNLPFSYLIEQSNNTYLVPGVNLRSVGTIRDAQKWPRRDARKDPDRLDFINYNLLSPFTIQKMFKGLRLLENLQYSSGMLSDIYSYHSTKIKNSSLRKGKDFYNIGITKFLGNSIISRLEGKDLRSDDDIRNALVPDSPVGSGTWVDLSGLLAPKSEVEKLLNAIEDGSVSTLDQVNEAFRTMNDNYYSYEWTWAYDRIEEYFGVKLDRISAPQVMEIVRRWQEAVISLDRMIYEDARKEFNLASQTGFGADGDKSQKEKDFESVRGDFEHNSFVEATLRHIEVKRALGDSMIEKMEKICAE